MAADHGAVYHILMNITQIIGDYQALVLDVLDNLDQCGIDVSNMQPDHIAYRAQSLQSFEQVKKRLDSDGDWQPEAVINGRPIGLLVLHEPLTVLSYRIPVVEVMAPKSGDNYPEGLEHVEFVTPVPLDELLRAYPGVSFDTRGASKAVNPELKLKFGRFNVKFHLCSVLEARSRHSR